MELETMYQYPCFMSNSNWFVQESQSTEWTREENKKFESALAIHDKDTPDRWLKVAAMIPGKTVFDVIKQYQELQEDVTEIEAGRVPIPGYLASSFTFELVQSKDYDGCRRKVAAAAGRGSDQERKKGVPWTEEEHRRFLMGLLKYGKGDWRNISRNFVFTKTPTQVASHAQKYYIRQKVSGEGKDNKRRPSIHDITTVNLAETATTLDNKDNKSGLLFDKSPTMLTPQKKLDWISHYNNGLVMVFDPNCDDLLVSSPSEIASKSLKQQGQDLYDCALYEAYAKMRMIPGFRPASRDFNKEADFGIHAL